MEIDRMPRLTVITREGSEVAVDANEGASVMEAIRDSGLEQLLALCGGCCSCATCHVYVDQADLIFLPPITSDEDELLNTSPHRLPTSRLSCQLEVSPVMNGIRVKIAPES